ncbi:MAG TPA: MlaD family protein [Allosphingosinicella sp.]|nr:MlaD family protein [Allosphingosinicella sp.]
METRSHKMLVFGVVAVLIAALIGYVIWASPAAGKRARHYEMHFERSVAGLQEGSPITFSGVAVGRVRKIHFDAQDPEIITVQALITDPKAPILEGTVATLKRDLFGQAVITLDGAATGAPPILPTHYGEIPIIPIKKQRGLMGDPLTLVENLSRTTDRLNAMLSPAGRKTISDQIAKLEARSGALATRAPALADTLANARTGIHDGALIAQQMGENGDAMDARIRAMHDGKVKALHDQMRSARAGIAKVNEGITAAHGKIRALADADLQGKVEDLRTSTAQFQEAVKKVDQEGLMAKPVTPEYRPGK